ncbi:beta-lactamase family protein [Candidatus Sumerlaeota bacterium]|nr:beta-lactamase family protein [Candidatus Sumerlaeota bacterium]
MSALQTVRDRIDAYCRQRLEESGIPGCSVLLTDREETLHEAGHGFADLAAKKPVTTETLFEYGSASKIFTVITVFQLCEQGRLNLDDPLTEHLTWFEVPTVGDRPVTIRQILCHMSGLVVGCDCAPNTRRGVWDVRHTPVPARPGEHHHYSNLAFEALGYMLEDMLGQTLEQILRSRILEPMGMRHSTAAVTNAVRPRMAVGYNPLFDERPRKPGDPIAPAPFHELRSACGSIATCATDLGLWVRMFLNRGRGLISEASFEEIIKPRTPTGTGAMYGYGLRLRDLEGGGTIGHTGGMVGYASDTMIDVEGGVGAATLLNAPGPVDWIATDIVKYGVRLLRALRAGEELPPVPAPLDPEIFPHAEECAGSYRSQSRSFDLIAEGGRLIMVHEGGRTPLLNDIRDRVWIPHPDWENQLMHFEREDGEVVAATHGPDFYPNQRYTGPTEFECPAEWRGFTGLYRSFLPWDTNFHVFTRRDQLIIVAPRCFGREQPLRPLHEPNLFGLGDETNPEWVRFDTVINGQAHRATLSGVDYHRMPPG